MKVKESPSQEGTPVPIPGSATTYLHELGKVTLPFWTLGSSSVKRL